MSHGSDGSARHGGSGRSQHESDDERTEILSDEYDYFYAPRRPTRDPAARPLPPGYGRSQRQQYGQGPSQDPGYPHQQPPPPRRPQAGAAVRPPRRRGFLRGSLRRKVGAVLGVLAVLVAALWLYVNAALTKVDALDDYEARPADTPGQTWLLVGSDSRKGLTAEERKELSTGKASGQRTDTIMLMHISPFGRQSTLVSIPRDTLATIPSFVDEDGDRVPAQQAKINEAFAYGGPKLLARTVEKKTGMHVDEYAEVGFGGFADVVNAVGGVRMCLDQPIHDRRAGANLQAGCQNLDGAEALAFVRSRYAVEGGDLGRVENQRKLLRNLADEVSSPTTFLNPIAMTRLLNSGIGALVVDESTGPFNLAWFGWHIKGVAGKGSITVPVEGTASVSGAGSVVVWDDAQARALFEALRENDPVPKSIRSQQN